MTPHQGPSKRADAGYRERSGYGPTRVRNGRGEVEVIRKGDTGQRNQVVAILGPDEFFGEMALIDNQPRDVSVRARTAVDALVMGKDVFSQISGSLVPFRLLLAQRLRWKRARLNPRVLQAWGVLQQRPLSDFVEAVPASFSPENRYDQVIRLFDEQVMEFACVRDEHGGLQGIVSKNELFQALEQGRGPATTVQEFMLREPVMATLDQTPLAVAE